MTRYELTIRTELMKKNITMKQFSEMITRATGLYCDSSYLAKILSGKRKSAEIIKAIDELLKENG